MKAAYYPAANRTAQDFSKAYPGVAFSSLRLLVLHTTETSGWPSYSGGASAPHFTAYPNASTKKLEFRQHFPLTMSARALKNASGGVQTNNDNVVQIELIGTCEKGGPGMFWAEAPDWALQGLADFIKWLNAEWSIPMTCSATWVSYPASYGFNASQRLSGSEWTNYKGILGHQHVPENDHGDPGLFPWARLVTFLEDELPLTTTDAKTVWNADIIPNMSADNVQSTTNPTVTPSTILSRLQQSAWDTNRDLAEVKGLVDTLESSAATSKADVAALRADVAGLNAKVVEVSTLVKSLQDSLGTVNDLGELQSTIKALVDLVTKLSGS